MLPVTLLCVDFDSDQPLLAMKGCKEGGLR